jgi:exodeoxyribonuclease-5
MSVGGYAGTGKTTLARSLAHRLGAGVTFAAPTHKAAAVLRAKVDAPVGTYHSLVYRPANVYRCRTSRRVVVADPDHQCGEEDCGCADRFGDCGGMCYSGCMIDCEPVFRRREVLDGAHALIVVDEASMLTVEQVDDIRSFGVPVLLIGDHGQLPPVKALMNPWMASPEAVLTVNHRQGDGSGIVTLAHAVRAGAVPRAGQHGEVAVLDARTHPSHVQGLLERFQPDENRAVIVWRNATRVTLNAALRGREGLPQAGDRVVCLKGCELPQADTGDPVYVHNGALGTVELAHGGRGSRVVRLEVMLDTGETVFTNAATAQFGKPETLAYNDPDKPRGRDWQSWDFGYAITAHKAQGSEFDDVIVIDENPMDYARWLYTAVTRARKRLVIVKW